MSSPHDFLAELNRLQIKLKVEGEKLRCQAPPGALTPEITAQLKRYKQEIIAFLKPPEQEAPIPVAPRTSSLKPSLSQHGLWLQLQMEGATSNYNIYCALDIEGPLRIEALRRATRLLVERHESLRYSICVEAGEPTLLINPAYDPLNITDLQNLPANRLKHLLDELVNQHARKPFDLTTGPLFDLHLLLVDENRNHLLFNMHHIISDGWSMANLVADWRQFYNDIVDGKPLQLDPLPVQFADYAAWQRERLQGEALENLLAYWERQLAEIPPLSVFPADYPRPAVMTAAGQVYQSALSPSVAAGVKTFSLVNGYTHFMTLLAGLEALLYRYSGSTDLVVGSPVANRKHSQTEKMIGFFVNVLAFRGRLHGVLSFHELAANLKQTALDAYAHQEAPFETIVSRLNPKRARSHSPVFQVMFAMQNTPQEVLQMRDLQVSYIGAEHNTSKFDLTLNVVEDETGFQCNWEYRSDLFRRETVARLADHFDLLLGKLLEDPKRAVGCVSLLTPSDRALLETLDRTGTPMPHTETFIALFQRQVTAQPDKTALVLKETHLTYHELNLYANRIAHDLIVRGITRNRVVVLCFSRGFDYLAGLLGVLKAGGAFAPLTPDHPDLRLQAVIERVRDTEGHAVVLCDEESSFRLMGLEGLSDRVDFVVPAWDAVARMDVSKTDPPSLNGPEDRAYLIHTSGSTGEPKGVLIPQRGLANLIRVQMDGFKLSRHSRLLQFAAYHFDASISEIGTALASGATLDLASDERLLPGEGFVQMLTARGVTHATLPSSFLAALPESAALGLETLVVAGEACTAQIISRHAENLCLIDAYGPTETSVCATMGIYRSVDDKPCIGRPIAYTAVFVLDADLNPMPPGLPGEICIAGSGLALGYYGRPELTAQKFVEAAVLGERRRLYRSGDRGRILPDGRIEFLGRLDHQIKLRGFRVELGEIEAVLQQHEAVNEAVVVLNQTGGQPRLIGYVTLSQPGSIDAEQLRQWLLQRLPEYMIPSAILILAQMPCTATGKINRDALPTPDIGGQAPQQEAQNPVEEICLELYSEALDFPVTSVQHDFFEHGGNSLAAARLATLIQDHFGVEFPINEIFDMPVLVDFAAWLALQEADPALKQSTAQPADLAPSLSFFQRRLWLLARLEDDAAVYNMPAALNLNGPLDWRALSLAFSFLIKRHQSLRSYFPEIAGEPDLQFLQPYDPLCLFDLRDLPPESAEAIARELIDRNAGLPFSLSEGPLVSLRLIALEPQRHILLFNMHHIIGDAWSMSIFIREWVHCYDAYLNDRTPSLPVLPIQYNDFAAQRNEQLQNGLLDGQWTYWREKLAGMPEQLDLKPDFRRPAIMRYRGATLQANFDKDLIAELNQLSRYQNTTLFVTLSAAFNVLLAAYSRQNDIVVGTPFANRGQVQTEHLLGPLLNTLVLRNAVDMQQSFKPFLAQVSQTALAAFAHGDLPFEDLVERLNPTRAMSHTPLFQVMFSLQNTPFIAPSLEGLAITACEFESPFAKFDLSLNIIEGGHNPTCQWEYNTDLFAAETIRDMAQRFQVLLRGIVAEPSAKLHELPLLTARDKQLLADWNATDAPFPKHQTLIDLFEARALRNPDGIALVYGKRNLTYQALKFAVDRLCLALTAHGAGPGVTIALAAARGGPMVAALLAIMQTGAAYLPLDPDLPPARKTFMLADSNAEILLCQPAVLPALPEPPAKLLDLDQLFDAGPAPLPAPSQAKAEAPAYLMYTSGSTGRPKGVQVGHLSLHNFLYGMQALLRPLETDRLQAVTPLSFDIAALELYLPLVCGACVVIASKDDGLDGRRLIDLVDRHRITIMQATPTTWQIMLGASWRPTRSMTVICGGEAMPPALGKALLALGHRLWNAYGPTETTIWSSMHHVSAHPERPELIGRPIANTEIHILDECNRPMPAGVPGELCIAGLGLALGYYNRAELTAEKFTTITLFGETKRVYRTGDLARRHGDGTLEFLGRLDYQVKLRGFRFELGEIENVLTAHPHVAQAVAVLLHGDNEPLLAAYLTLRQPLDQVESVLRSHLKGLLPDYMIPNAFTVLEALPKTPNGKIDRKALPRPNAIVAAPQRAPVTATERTLCGLWSEVLGRRIDTTRAHFFEVGGHSLSATRLVSRIAGTFSLDMPLRVVFQRPVLSEQAQWLDDHSGLGRQSRIEVLGDDHPPVMSFAQIRLWFLAQLEGRTATYNMPSALRVEGPLSQKAVEQAVAALIERHRILRLCFPADDGRPKAAVMADPTPPLSLVDCSHLAESERHRWLQTRLAEHGSRPFELERGPLWSLVLLRNSERDHTLLFNMHHIISDAWSMGILVRDWGYFYSIFAEGGRPEIAALPIQYADYAAWQTKWLREGALESQRNYWMDRLNGAPPLLELPTDHPRPAVMRYRGRHLHHSLSESLSKQIKDLGRNNEATDFMTLLAIFNILLFRYSGQTDLVVGTPIANRTHHYSEDLIGFFVNTLVCRNQFDPNLAFAAFLERVRDGALEAYANQDIPFVYLVEQINPVRDLSCTPLFQVMFVLQNAPTRDLQLAGLHATPIECEAGTAKFDLTLNIVEQDNRFVCDWEFSTDLFEAHTIQRMARHFEILAKAIVASDSPLAGIPLLTAEELASMEARNNTGAAYPENITALDLFLSQVQKTPEAVAVVHGNQTITYAELERASNGLALHLQKRGAVPGVLVGLLMDRTPELMAAFWAVLKTGAAWLPLDPAHPQGRLAFMLEDAQPAIIITAGGLTDRLPATSAEVLVLDESFHACDAVDLEPPKVDPRETAYLIYTSGSTGKPKGVSIHRRGFANYLQWARDAYQPAPGSGVPVFSSISFDATITCLVLPLLCGAHVILLPEQDKLENLVRLMVGGRRLGLVKITPAHLEALNHQLRPEQFADAAQLLVIGGERLDASQIEPWLRNAPQVRLINEYGPTETVVGCTIHEIQPQDLQRNAIPIGRPIANTRVYILDANLIPTPPGVPGELCIAGTGVALGYLNRSALTAEKFIKIKPYGQWERVYRTGDIARLNIQGQLEFLGRRDHQVKWHGYRIELQEIEAAVKSHQLVREAAVVLQKSGEHQLLAGFVQPDLVHLDHDTNGRAADRIGHWREVFESTYSPEKKQPGDPAFNFAGWSSSYDGAHIPEAEMRRWLDETVARIRARNPRRILEIGCGTGLLLFSLLPHCLEYTGVDLSTHALQHIHENVTDLGLRKRLTLHHGSADRVGGLGLGMFDTVIINSVVQYFPSMDYLENLIKSTVAMVEPGGSIFIGDVRDFRLWEAFHLSVSLAKASDAWPLSKLRRQMHKAKSQERELLVDPAYFLTLGQRIPQISQVQLSPKAGDDANEMVRFRYDAVLVVSSQTKPTRPAFRSWKETDLTVAEVKQILERECPPVLAVEGIPDGRLTVEKLMSAQSEASTETVGVLAARAGAAKQMERAVTPNDMCVLAAGLPYRVDLLIDGAFDFKVVYRRQEPGTLHAPLLDSVVKNLQQRPLATYSNTINLDRRAGDALIDSLRDHLRDQLPDYMIPARFSLLNQLPLTSNGKVDRRLLAEWETVTASDKGKKPRNTLELQLCEIWCEVLGLAEIGVDDDFFEQGGHSLAAVRLTALIERRLGYSVSTALLFQHPTIARLAERLIGEVDQPAGRSLVQLRQVEDAQPLFLFHAAGGSLFPCFELVRRLPFDKAIYGFEAAGLESGGSPEMDVTQMAASYLKELLNIQPKGPYHLLGWSSGGLTAFEVARQLEQRGETVALLSLLDTTHPSRQGIEAHQLSSGPQTDELALLTEVLADLDRYASGEASEKLDAVIVKAMAVNLIPPEIDARQARRFVSTLAAGIQAGVNYQPGLLRADITFFRPIHKDSSSNHVARNGWHDHTSGRLVTIDVPGDHFNMLAVPHVAVLAEKLRGLLTRRSQV